MTNNRKVDFREGDKDTSQKREEAIQQETISSKLRRRKLKTGDSPSGFCCSDISYFTDRGEADDENSQHGCCGTAKHDLDERPQKENYEIDENFDGSMFDCYEDFYPKPLLRYRLKPALLRAVNWIFGGCPEASRKAALKHDVGKEEIRRVTDEWLH